MNLHGSGSNALQASVYGDVPRSAAERGMLVVTPEALEGRWELGGTGADADFLIGLLDDVVSRYCVDPDRVHLMGMSLGAWKAAATACSFPDRFASAALVTVEVFPESCEPLPGDRVPRHRRPHRGLRPGWRHGRRRRHRERGAAGRPDQHRGLGRRR